MKRAETCSRALGKVLQVFALSVFCSLLLLPFLQDVVLPRCFSRARMVSSSGPLFARLLVEVCVGVSANANGEADEGCQVHSARLSS